MNRITQVLLTTILTATAALAHSGVKDPQVKARMDGMTVLGAQTKILGQMAKGATPFNASKAQAAIQVIQTETKKITALFEPRADDPKSEAKLEIWTDWTAFTEKTDGLSLALAEANVTTAESLGRSVRTIGAACSACHKQFRE
ncbi:MAG: c-type cytochrome [Boseongicola sp.]